MVIFHSKHSFRNSIVFSVLKSIEEWFTIVAYEHAIIFYLLCDKDTVVALHALSEYATKAYTGNLDLTVTVESTNMDLQHRFVLNQSNSGIEQVAKIPSIPAGLFVSAVGDGCGLLQVS